MMNLANCWNLLYDGSLKSLGIFFTMIF